MTLSCQSPIRITWTEKRCLAQCHSPFQWLISIWIWRLAPFDLIQPTLKVELHVGSAVVSTEIASQSNFFLFHGYWSSEYLLISFLHSNLLRVCFPGNPAYNSVFENCDGINKSAKISNGKEVFGRNIMITLDLDFLNIGANGWLWTVSSLWALCYWFTSLSTVPLIL